MDYLKETPSQTAGPYVHIGLAPAAAGFDAYDRELGFDPVPGDVPGDRIRITGRVIDGMGAPVKDVLIETWQADAAGLYPGQPGAAAGFRGWSRVVPDFETGDFVIDTIRPGAHGRHAPHIALWLVARGINVGLQTRVYLPDADNDADPVLNLIEQPHRRRSLIATGEGGAYHFDIHLQGDQETVFLDV
ncbi:protocatechuate 3,4-dioxygenase subunit alpha [Paracoccus aestuarii]|uniref:Protocatechuate 3,4-dioxygenase subunit alpha n=1 Tax=Paracoccus aestuarii TaxID=453842 RepID=A0A418ZQ99_9RHOB|nr:protocatechuate 3,4-dioxygenase subunit alpha [Paracoccus aestuarii]RJK96576.1 protocatechuate 3,4-dioxygenase subunit alpha [Paracoccus aestuarii]WCR01239.1 protocatechuate 3,4-dioxygenase subunit alpha [Paracoccus aestuarii]